MKTINGVTLYELDEMPLWGDEPKADCPAQTPHGLAFLCTRDKGHPGRHKAQLVNNRVCAEW